MAAAKGESRGGQGSRPRLGGLDKETSVPPLVPVAARVEAVRCGQGPAHLWVGPGGARRCGRRSARRRQRPVPCSPKGGCLALGPLRGDAGGEACSLYWAPGEGASAFLSLSLPSLEMQLPLANSERTSSHHGEIECAILHCLKKMHVFSLCARNYYRSFYFSQHRLFVLLSPLLCLIVMYVGKKGREERQPSCPKNVLTASLNLFPLPLIIFGDAALQALLPSLLFIQSEINIIVSKKCECRYISFRNRNPLHIFYAHNFNLQHDQILTR